MAKQTKTSIDVKLTDGIDVDGTLTYSITVRKPKVKDLLNAERQSKGESDANVRFLANLTDLTPDQIGELSIADYKKLNEVLAGFLGEDSQT